MQSDLHSFDQVSDMLGVLGPVRCSSGPKLGTTKSKSLVINCLKQERTSENVFHLHGTDGRSTLYKIQKFQVFWSTTLAVRAGNTI